MLDYIRDPAEITRRSFAIVAAEANLASLPPEIAPLAARIVHASGMPDLVADLAFTQGAAAAGHAALAARVPILCDVRMVASGLMTRRLTAGNTVHVAIDQPGGSELA